MKKIGLLGGVGWPSTAEYYRLICQASQSYHRQLGADVLVTPEMLIESLNLQKSLQLRGDAQNGSWSAWDDYFRSALKRLEAAGAELLGIASVTPHARLAHISKGVSTPVVSVYDALGQYCRRQSIGKLLVLGTLPTMTNGAFARGLSGYPVAVCSPEAAADLEQIHGLIQRLYQGANDGADHLLSTLAKRVVSPKQFNSTAVCLACTELPIAFFNVQDEAQFECDGVLFLNASVIHAQALFNAALDS